MEPDRRTYDNSRRQEQARQRRTAILDACGVLLDRGGYADLTIRAVAEAAGVSQETVYKAFGSKRRLVKAFYDRALAGDDEPVPMARRPAVQALLAEPDPYRKVAGYARLARQVSERVGMIAARLGAGGAEAAAITAETDRERLAGVTGFVAHLAAGGHLRAGLDPGEAADACWLLISPEVYRLATAERGWNGDTYAAWLTRMLTAALLEPPRRVTG